MPTSQAGAGATTLQRSASAAIRLPSESAATRQPGESAGAGAPALEAESVDAPDLLIRDESVQDKSRAPGRGIGSVHAPIHLIPGTAPVLETTGAVATSLASLVMAKSHMSALIVATGLTKTGAIRRAPAGVMRGKHLLTHLRCRATHPLYSSNVLGCTYTLRSYMRCTR